MAIQSGNAGSHALTSEQTELVRTRVRLLVEITARAGKYRNGLLAAAAQLSPEEAAVIVDLSRHGLRYPSCAMCCAAVTCWSTIPNCTRNGGSNA